MTTTTLQEIIGGSSITEDSSFKELFTVLWKLKLFETKIDSPLITVTTWEFYLWLFCVGVVILFGIGFLFTKVFRIHFFKHAFEKMKFKRRDIEKSVKETLYLEITLPTNSQATAFQIQQKILKTFHSIYTDPVAHLSAFSPLWHFFQKVYRFTRVYFSHKVFFTLQIWGEYPDIVFRLNIPKDYYDRIEKALYDAYPGAEITILDKEKVFGEVEKYKDSFVSYGQTTIKGKFYHRVKTFKDVSSDPVDSIIATMEGLKEGQFMVYNLCLSPTSHYFNQLIHYLLEEEEREHKGVFDKTQALKQIDVGSPDLRSQLRTAMIEKMKASLFQVVISYWTILPTAKESQAKLANIQSVLTQVNQKNMNTLEHKRLFTKRVSELSERGNIESILSMCPVLKRNRIPYVPLLSYKNYGQIVSDGELYSLWHLANLTTEKNLSLKVIKFKKLPATQEMRLCKPPLYIDLGSSNFKMHEDNRLGIPSWEDMKKHVYILGGTGAGKSETLKTILKNLLEKKDIEKTALLIVDPKNDFATDLLAMIPEERKDDVIYFNPSRQKEQPLGFPFFSKFSGEKTNDERIEFLISIMKRFVQIDSTYSWGPELENILRQLFATAYLLPEQSLSGLDQLLHEPHQIKNLNKFLPPRLQQFWTDSILKRTSNDLMKYLATTNNKIGKFLDYPEFTNIADRLDTKITFEEMIRTGKIFIANLGSSSEQMKKYYSVYLTAHIAEAIFDQARFPSSDRKPTVFVVDEFQRVSSDIFETLFSEVRAFNTALVISNQFMGQLDIKIQKSIESNIATKIFMRTQSVDDAEIAEKILGGKVTVEDIINLPTGAAYLKTLVNGIPQTAMSVQIEKTQLPDISEQEVESYFIQQSMERYGTPLTEIKQKRESINSLYYTADRQKEFLIEMEKIQIEEHS